MGVHQLIKPLGGAIPHAATEEIPATDTTPAIEAMPATDGLSWGAFVLIALLPLLYVICTTVGYYMGTRRISVLSKLVYKDDKKKPTRKRPFKKLAAFLEAILWNLKSGNTGMRTARQSAS